MAIVSYVTLWKTSNDGSQIPCSPAFKWLEASMKWQQVWKREKTAVFERSNFSFEF